MWLNIFELVGQLHYRHMVGYTLCADGQSVLEWSQFLPQLPCLVYTVIQVCKETPFWFQSISKSTSTPPDLGRFHANVKTPFVPHDQPVKLKVQQQQEYRIIEADNIKIKQLSTHIYAITNADHLSKGFCTNILVATKFMDRLNNEAIWQSDLKAEL